MRTTISPASARRSTSRPARFHRHHRDGGSRLLDDFEGEPNQLDRENEVSRHAEGRLPLGFLALDLAQALDLPLVDPDDGYKPLRRGQHTKYGNGLIGGDKIKPKVVVAANGGSDLIYLPDGDQAI